MIAGILGIAIFVVMVVMSTLGSVLLVQFVASKWRRGLRILAATLLGPGLMLVPLSLVALFDGSPDALAGFLGIGIIGMLICGIVSWPVAHLATKKLDRLTVFDIETFE